MVYAWNSLSLEYVSEDPMWKTSKLPMLSYPHVSGCTCSNNFSELDIVNLREMYTSQIEYSIHMYVHNIHVHIFYTIFNMQLYILVTKFEMTWTSGGQQNKWLKTLINVELHHHTTYFTFYYCVTGTSWISYSSSVWISYAGNWASDREATHSGKCNPW